MYKKIVLLVSFLSLAILFQSCQNDDSYADGLSQDPEKEIIVQDGDDTRMNRSELGVVGTKGDQNQTSEKSSLRRDGIEEDNVASDLPLINIASVNPPVINGITLKATHVALYDNYAYVSYNVEGGTYMGAIDVIDVSDPNSPVLASQALFPNTDLNSIAYYSGTLLVAGANASINQGGTDPALLFKVGLSQGIPTGSMDLIDMTGYAALDVKADGNNVYGVSGNNGVLAGYDQNGNLQNSVSVADLRAVGVLDNKVVALSGISGIHVYDANNFNETLNFATSQDTPEAKRTIAFYEGKLLVAEGSEGLGVYDLGTGTQLNTLSLPDLSLLDENIDPAEVVTNAVSTLDDHILVAQGAAGVSLFGVSSGVTNVTDMGVLNLEGSANYVKGEGDYIFVADGRGGLKILKKLVSDGDNLDGTIVCEDYAPYTGGSWMNINSYQPQAYSGAASVNGLNVNDELIFCGSLAVSQQLNINSGGSFYMSGSLVFGNNGTSLNMNDFMQVEGSVVIYGNLNLNSGASFQVNGDLTVYGNITLNANSTIEFQGNNSTATVYGNVIQNGSNNIDIIGNFTDTENKF